MIFFLNIFTKIGLLNWYSLMKKKRKIWIIFGIQKWLWKTEFGNLAGLITSTGNVQNYFQCNLYDQWSISFTLKSFYKIPLMMWKFSIGFILFQSLRNQHYLIEIAPLPHYLNVSSFFQKVWCVFQKNISNHYPEHHYPPKEKMLRTEIWNMILETWQTHRTF